MDMPADITIGEEDLWLSPDRSTLWAKASDPDEVLRLNTKLTCDLNSFTKWGHLREVMHIKKERQYEGSYIRPQGIPSWRLGDLETWE
jgi:hypothetical protein